MQLITVAAEGCRLYEGMLGAAQLLISYRTYVTSTFI